MTQKADIPVTEEFEYKLSYRGWAEGSHSAEEQVEIWLNREGKDGWQVASLNTYRTSAVMMRRKR